MLSDFISRRNPLFHFKFISPHCNSLLIIQSCSLKPLRCHLVSYVWSMLFRNTVPILCVLFLIIHFYWVLSQRGRALFVVIVVWSEFKVLGIVRVSDSFMLSGHVPSYRCCFTFIDGETSFNRRNEMMALDVWKWPMNHCIPFHGTIERGWSMIVLIVIGQVLLAS